MRKWCEYASAGIVVVFVVAAAYIGGWIFFIEGATKLLKMLHGTMPITEFNVFMGIVKVFAAGVVVFGIVIIGALLGNIFNRLCKHLNIKGVKNG